MIFYVECFIQRGIIYIVRSGVRVEHLSGRSTVCNKLRMVENATGIIDEDPQAIQHPYLKECKLMKNVESIKLYKDNKRKNYLLIFCPRAEEWIFETAQKEGIKLKDFNFSEDFKKFNEEIKISISKFQQLLHKLKKESKRFETLEGIFKNIL
ncbi:MAG: hypothetical protein ABIL75_02055 [candidate division WOR-3 bacterium]